MLAIPQELLLEKCQLLLDIPVWCDNSSILHGGTRDCHTITTMQKHIEHRWVRWSPKITHSVYLIGIDLYKYQHALDVTQQQLEHACCHRQDLWTAFVRGDTSL